MRTFEFETPTVNNKGEIIARTRHSAEIFTEDLRSNVSLNMVVISAGSCQMGSRPFEGNPDERPQHFIRIGKFMIGQCLITQGRWKAVI